MKGSQPTRLLLVGCGAFARQAHLPALARMAPGVRLASVVDRGECLEPVRQALEAAGLDPHTPLLATPDPRTLPPVDAVIISSPEGTHKPYLRWALEQRLPTLSDKPLTTRTVHAGTLSDPRSLVDDWEELTRLSGGSGPFMVAAQRRYQEVYRTLGGLVRREFLRSGYAPTFVQCLTNDGLWHDPEDYALQSTYRDGAGKLIHTGYHVLDILPWILRHAQAPERPGSAIARVRSARVQAEFFRPEDAVAAWAPPRDGGRAAATGMGPAHGRRIEGASIGPAAPLGEVNAALQVALLDGEERTVCLLQMGTLHEGLSLNPGPSATRPDDTLETRRLRAHAGRTKQDVLSIYQGPTGAVWLRRFARLTGADGTALGDRNHLELVVARNPHAPGTAALLDTRSLTYRADDHAPTLEFLRALHDPGLQVRSPTVDHGIPVRLLAAAYRSAEEARSVRVEFGAGEWGPPPGVESDPHPGEPPG